ncbi:MAG TPA: hypothetical protein VFG49_15835 [Dyella sp.]|uniref:hypothetical protein n=1 Tax=Dyella sp. TaxID=1869338 RepID=UPI002D767C21|nr:hypothetical protein [Dyella sp.]HET6554998.1 hypothetical protein [Dyella sp.]
MARLTLREKVPTLDPHSSLALMHVNAWLKQGRGLALARPDCGEPVQSTGGREVKEPVFVLPYEKA